MKIKTIINIVNKCPLCKNNNVTINFDYDIKQYTLECFKCNKKYVLSYGSSVQCPSCGGEKFIHEKYESYCFNCGLVMSGTSRYVAGIKINYPWGLRF